MDESGLNTNADVIVNISSIVDASASSNANAKYMLNILIVLNEKWMTLILKLMLIPM